MNKWVKQAFVVVAEPLTVKVDCHELSGKRMGRELFTHAPHTKLLATTIVSYHNRDCHHS